MTFRILSESCDHVLPDAANYRAGTVIQCEACRRMFWRDRTIFTNRPYWSDDWAW